MPTTKEFSTICAECKADIGWHDTVRPVTLTTRWGRKRGLLCQPCSDKRYSVRLVDDDWRVPCARPACGRTMIGKKSKYPPKFCSIYCNANRDRALPRNLAQCVHCGEDFKPKRATAMFCSSNCRVKAHRDKT